MYGYILPRPGNSETRDRRAPAGQSARPVRCERSFAGTVGAHPVGAASPRPEGHRVHSQASSPPSPTRFRIPPLSRIPSCLSPAPRPNHSLVPLAGCQLFSASGGFLNSCTREANRCQPRDLVSPGIPAALAEMLSLGMPLRKGILCSWLHSQACRAERPQPARGSGQLRVFAVGGGWSSRPNAVRTSGKPRHEDMAAGGKNRGKVKDLKVT